MSIRLQRKDGFARLVFSRESVPFDGNVLVPLLICDEASALEGK